jgi:hypothetical protein
VCFNGQGKLYLGIYKYIKPICMIYMYNIVLTQVCVFSCSFARQVSRDVLEAPEFLCDKAVVIRYRLLQLLCTYPSTINHKLANYDSFTAY